MTTQAAPSASLSSNDLQTLLDEAPPRVWWRRTWVWATVALVALGAAGIYAWQDQSQSKAAPSYVTETVGRGKLTLSVSANGTLQPTTFGQHRQRTLRHRATGAGGCE
jgi:HlyD family secretion protein